MFAGAGLQPVTINYSIIISKMLFDMFTKRQTLVSSPTESVKLIVVREDTYHGIEPKELNKL